jgi:hypothetical protein
LFVSPEKLFQTFPHCSFRPKNFFRQSVIVHSAPENV